MFPDDKFIVSVDDAQHSVGSRDASFAASFSFRLTKDATREECVELMKMLFESMMRRVGTSYDQAHPTD